MQNQFNILLNVAEGAKELAPRDLYLGIYQQASGVGQDSVVSRPRPVANRRGVDEFAVAVTPHSGFVYSVEGRMLLKRPGQRARPLPVPAAEFVEVGADGASVLCTYRSGGLHLLCRVDTLTGEKTAILRSEREIAGFALFSSGQSALVGIHREGGTELLEVDMWGRLGPGSGILRWRGRSLPASQLALSGDGDSLAFVDSIEGDVFVKDLRSGTVRQLSRPDTEEGGFPDCPRFSPDGSRVLYCQGGQLWVSAARGGRISPVFGNCRHHIVQAFPLGDPSATGFEHFRGFAPMRSPLAVPPGYLRRQVA